MIYCRPPEQQNIIFRFSLVTRKMNSLAARTALFFHYNLVKLSYFVHFFFCFLRLPVINEKSLHLLQQELWRSKYKRDRSRDRRNKTVYFSGFPIDDAILIACGEQSYNRCYPLRAAAYLLCEGNPSQEVIARKIRWVPYIAKTNYPRFSNARSLPFPSQITSPFPIVFSSKMHELQSAEVHNGRLLMSLSGFDGLKTGCRSFKCKSVLITQFCAKVTLARWASDFVRKSV